MAALLGRLGEFVPPLSTAADLFHEWTRREARTKALGGALFDKPAEGIRAIDITAPAGYAASVALAGYEPFATYRTLS